MLFGKFARVGNDHPIPESDPFHNNELPQREYDPEKAAFHAKKAGLGTADVILSGLGRGVQRRDRHVGAVPGDRRARPASTSP